MRIPSAGTPISLIDLFAGLKAILSGKVSIKAFEEGLRHILGVKKAFAVGSGAAAFYISLEVLKRLSNKKEVVLPAYTAPVLKLPVERAGLKIRLCEVSLKTFNLDPLRLEEVLTEDTLCIVAVHLFGIPCEMPKIQKIAMENGVFLIEDNAQSLGSRIDGKLTGGGGDIGILSFQRGKNLSTYTGGAVVTSSEVIGELIKKEFDRFGLGKYQVNLPIIIKTFLVSMIVKPEVYGIIHPLAAPFKSRELHKNFDVKDYTPFQAGLGISLLKRLEEFSIMRNRNGMKLLNGLSGRKGYILPLNESFSTNPLEGSFPAFSQFPVIVEDKERVEKLQERLWDEGTEATRMYLKPMHRLFDLGYPDNPDPFPNATFMAERLLLLPTHPFVPEMYLARVVEIIRSKS